jgi:hypothetical protein
LESYLSIAGKVSVFCPFGKIVSGFFVTRLALMNGSGRAAGILRRSRQFNEKQTFAATGFASAGNVAYPSDSPPEFTPDHG